MAALAPRRAATTASRSRSRSTPDPNDASKYIVNSAPSTLQAADRRARCASSYIVFTNPTPLDYCVTENDFAFADHSEDARWPRRPFAPFAPVSDRAPALHFGFTPQAAGGAREPAGRRCIDAGARTATPQPFVWDYWGARGWTELSVRDTTAGLRQTGLIQFVGAPDALPREGLGGALYRIRARLKTGLASQQQVVRSAACG